MQKIANENDEFNIKIYEKLTKQFNSIKNLYECSKDINILYRKLENTYIDKSIIKLLNEDNIKEEVNKKYTELLKSDIKIITIEDKEYPKEIKENNYEFPFCILVSNKINLNNKTIYIYYDEYFTKFAKNIVCYFSKIINNEKCNVICNYQNREVNNIQIKIADIFKEKNLQYEKCIVLPNIKSYYSYILKLVDFMIIIEARYEEKIVKLVNYFLENGKDIYVVPSNVFRKNSYFSNYLIKQGADVILNKQDLKYILNNITC